MEHPDNEIEDISDEKLDPANDVTDGEENDANDGDIGDMPKLRTMLHHFQGDDRLSKEYKEFHTLQGFEATNSP
jgi:hypothetical protein